MQIIACQLDIAWEDKAASHQRVARMLAAADVSPGALVVLPEMFATGFSMDVAAIADDQTHETHDFCAALAREHHVYVLAGVVSGAPDGRGRNEAVAFAPDGSQLARYCKLHPFSLAGESDRYEAGDDLVTFRWHDVTVCPLICYDLRFPEAFRRGVAHGAELFAVIANWPAPRAAHWTTLLHARAIENQAVVVGVNRTGRDPQHSYIGQSAIIDPHGESLIDAGEHETLIAAEVDAQLIRNWRQKFPALRDIRADHR